MGFDDLFFLKQHVIGKKPKWPYRLKKSHQLTKHLAGAWILDDSMGGNIVVDLCGNNDGIRVGSTIKTTSTNAGIGVDFSGNNTSDRFNLGSINSNNRLCGNNANAITCIAGGIFRGLANNPYPRIFDKSDGGGVANGYGFDIYATGHLFFQAGGGTSVGQLSSSTVPLNRYVNMAAVMHTGASGYKIYYFDGVHDNTTSALSTTIPSVTTNAAIGNWNHSTDREWNGTLDYLFIFDKPGGLTAGEIKSLHDDPYQFIEEVRPLNKDSIYAAIFPVSGGFTFNLNHAAESNISQILVKTKNYGLSNVAESDLSVLLAKQKQLQLLQVSENNTANSLIFKKHYNLSVTAEINQAIDLFLQSGIPLNATSEINSSTALTKQKNIALSNATESDSSQSITFNKIHTLIQANETDTAQALIFNKIKSLIATAETDTVNSLFILSGLIVNNTTETNSAGQLTKIKNYTLGAVAENDTAQALATGAVKLLSAAQEFDVTQSLISSKLINVSSTSEVESVVSLAFPQTITAGQAVETDQALLITLGSGAVYLICDYGILTAIEETGLLTAIEETGLLTGICGRTQ